LGIKIHQAQLQKILSADPWRIVHTHCSSGDSQQKAASGDSEGVIVCFLGDSPRRLPATEPPTVEEMLISLKMHNAHAQPQSALHTSRNCLLINLKINMQFKMNICMYVVKNQAKNHSDFLLKL
jgi:hypothetical protein